MTYVASLILGFVGGLLQGWLANKYDVEGKHYLVIILSMCCLIASGCV
jgi:uncharacterized membrane protein YeaQ/YmgE (transglycosylase-associated protein family)